MQRNKVLMSSCLASAAVLGIAACSLGTDGSDPSAGSAGERVESVASPVISVASQNYKVNGAFDGVHETSVASAYYQNSPLVGFTDHWVVGFNTYVRSREMGWSYSTGAGNTWVAKVMNSITDFGTPPERAPSDWTSGAPTTWNGLEGDPSLVPVYDPTISNGGRRVMYSMVSSSSANMATDAAIMLSEDGGVTWGKIHYINTVATGVGVDNPVIASGSAAPYPSYATWTAAAGGFIASIRYDAAGVFTAGTPLAIPSGGASPIVHPVVSIGQLANCSGTHPAVYVSWATAGSRCGGTTSAEIQNNSWFTAVYDISTNEFLGPWLVASDSTWPNCAGAPLGPGSASHDSRPRLAADPNGTTFYIGLTKSSPNGTRMNIFNSRLECSAGHVQPAPGGPPWVSPEPCYNQLLGCAPGAPNLPDGGFAYVDEWGPAIAFSYKPDGTPRVLATWYSTRTDVNNRNVGIVGTWSENRTTFSNTLLNVSVPTSGSSDSVPWDHTRAAWDDYQGIGASRGTFLNAWGGDARARIPGSRNSYKAIYSAVLN